MPVIPFEGHTPKIHPTAFIAPTAVVIGDVEIGEEASIWYGAVLRGDLEPIRIGARSNVQDNAVLHTGLGEPCIVEEEVTIGHMAIVHGCTLKKKALIGMGSCVLNRAVIGEECILGAKALVPEDKVFEPRQLIVGVPARALRAVTEQELANLRVFNERYVKNRDCHTDALKSWDGR